MLPVGQNTVEDLQQDLTAQEKCGDKTEQRNRHAEGVRTRPPSPGPIFRDELTEDLLTAVQAPVA